MLVLRLYERALVEAVQEPARQREAKALEETGLLTSRSYSFKVSVLRSGFSCRNTAFEPALPHDVCTCAVGLSLRAKEISRHGATRLF